MADIIAVKNLTTQEVLYGDRTTQYRWEVLEHPPVRRNLAKNPSGRVDTFGMLPLGVGAGIFQDMGADVYATTTTAGQAPGNFGVVPSILKIGVDIAPNTRYVVSAGVYAATAGAIKQPGIYALTAGGAGTFQTFPAASGFTRRQVTFTTGASGDVYVYILNGETTSAGTNVVGFQDLNIELESTFDPAIPYFDGRANNVSYFEGVANRSASFRVPTSDRLIGVLDGVSDGSLTWTQNSAVKGRGKAEVIDLSAEQVQAGMKRIGDLKLESMRVRPVCVIQGLPENPLGTFLVSAAGEKWEDTGRVWSLELLDRSTVPSQDKTEETYAVAAGTLILQQVRTLLATTGEHIAINEASTAATSTGMVWEAGTSKLTIINDLLDVAGYNALWVDGFGNFQATPRVLPANRSITYEALGFPRELRDGELSIYSPSWTRDRDSFEVPNKVVAVQAAPGEGAAAIIGTWTNQDAASPYSYQARGRWIPYVLDSVECPAGTAAEILAFLQARARATLVQMSAVQAQVKTEHLPIPVRVSDVIRFSHTKAGVDARHVITSLSLDTHPLGMMKSTLQEVISL